MAHPRMYSTFRCTDVQAHFSKWQEQPGKKWDGRENGKREGPWTLTAHITQLTMLPRADPAVSLLFACWLGLKTEIGFLWMLANAFLAMGTIAFCCVCKMWIHSFLISVICSKELNPICKEIGSDKPWKYNVPLWLQDAAAGGESVSHRGRKHGNTLPASSFLISTVVQKWQDCDELGVQGACGLLLPMVQENWGLPSEVPY